jgi:hypothetical protein
LEEVTAKHLNIYKISIFFKIKTTEWGKLGYFKRDCDLNDCGKLSLVFSSSGSWVLDSGASKHMTGNLEGITMVKAAELIRVILANGKDILINHC